MCIWCNKQKINIVEKYQNAYPIKKKNYNVNI